MKNTIIGIVVVVVVAAVGWYGWNQKKEESTVSTQPIKIGAVLSLTGYAAVDGLHIKRGLELAQTDLAAKGVDVEIVYEDDATDPKQSVSAVNKLMAGSDKPEAIVGPVWSFLIEAALPVINEKQVVAYVPSATSEVVNDESNYIFYGTYKNSEEVEPLADWLKENKKTKAAVVVSNDAWGESHLLAFAEAVKKAGGSIVLTEKINFGSDAEVIPTIIPKIKSAGADVVLWTGYDEAGTLLVKRSQEQKLGLPIVAAASVMEGLVNRGTVVLGETDQVYMVDIPMAKDFREKYLAAYGEEPSTYSDSAYDGLMILAKAIAAKGDNHLADEMRDIKYEGYLGKYQFDDNGDMTGGAWEIVRLK